MTDEAGRLSINDLPLHDQLLYGIGRVAQAQVQVEVQVEIILRHLYTALALPSVAVAHLGPRRNSIDQLAQDCRLMLANSPCKTTTRAQATTLSGPASRRTASPQVVHEWWVKKMDPNDPTTASYERMRADKKTIGYASEPGDLAFNNDAETALQRAYIRINELVFAITNLMLVDGPLPPGAPYDENLLPAVRGEVTLLPGGGWRVDRPPSPE